MSLPTRLAIVAWLLALSLFLVVGQWRFQGPVLYGATEGHGVHAGDLVVAAVTALAAIRVLRAR